MTVYQRQIGLHSRPALSQPSITAFLNNAEVVAALLILIFPIMGTFFAPETYFLTSQDFSIAGASDYEAGFPFARLTFMAIVLWEFYLFWKLPRTFLKGLLTGTLPLSYIVWTLFSGLLTADPSTSMNRSFRLLLICVFAAYLAERFSTKQLLRILAISGCVAILATLFAVVVLPKYGLTTLVGYEGAWRGATTHKNSLGALMAQIFIFSYFAYRSRIAEKKFGLFLLFGSLFELVMARSMTALITAVITLFLAQYFNFIIRLQGKAEKIIMLIVGALLLFGMYIAQSLLEDLLQLLGRSSDFTGRKDVWEMSWYLIGRNPIWGYGSGFWSIANPDRDYVWNVLNWAPPQAHNNFLDIWLQLGIPGLLLMSAIIAICVFRLTILLLHERRAINIIWPIVIVSIFFGGLTETNLVEGGAPFWLTLAFIKIKKIIAHESSA